jgi:hypothetical protein
MSYYASPEKLRDNPPETWRVQRIAPRRWGLQIDSDHMHSTFTFDTKRAALAERDDPQSYTRREVEKERRWYAGDTPPSWKPYEQCRAEWRDS